MRNMRLPDEFSDLLIPRWCGRQPRRTGLQVMSLVGHVLYDTGDDTGSAGSGGTAATRAHSAPMICG